MRIVVVAVSILLASSARAEVEAEFGVRLGVGAASVWGDTSSEEHRGPTGGLTMALDFGGPVAVQAELQYVEKGGRNVVSGSATSIPQADKTIYQNARLQYLEVPVLARWQATGKSGLYLVGGVFVGFLLGSEVEFAEDYQWGYLPDPTDPIGYGDTIEYFGAMTDIDSGFIVGIGFALSLGTTSVGIDLRWERGLKDLNKHELHTLHSDVTMASLAVGF